MPPLRPIPGSYSRSRNTDGYAILTRPLTMDEWAGEHLATLHGTHLTHEEVAEAERLLSTLHELVGEQAAEVMGFLTTLLHRRDGASMSLLRWLRSLDGLARS